MPSGSQSVKVIRESLFILDSTLRKALRPRSEQWTRLARSDLYLWETATLRQPEAIHRDFFIKVLTEARHSQKTPTTKSELRMRAQNIGRDIRGQQVQN